MVVYGLLFVAMLDFLSAVCAVIDLTRGILICEHGSLWV